MATWKNLDTLASYSKLAELKGHVNIADAMAGEKGAERVKKYSTPMAAGLTYNYAAKQVDETVLDALAKLADEAELIDKFQEFVPFFSLKNISKQDDQTYKKLCSCQDIAC